MKSAPLSKKNKASITPRYVGDLKERIARLERENQLLQEKIHYLAHRHFGRRSEVFDAGQGILFDSPADGANETGDPDTYGG